MTLSAAPGNRKGRFIAFEGGEGSGKSTQISKIHDWLIQEKGQSVICTREPGGSPLGNELRKLLLNSSASIAPRSEALLFAASRAQHVEEVILPALEEGKWVLCDRYLDASLAYQGIGRKLGVQNVYNINLWATQELLPEKTFLLNISAKEGMKRAQKRAQNQDLDRIESESLEFHQKINDFYRERAQSHPKQYFVVDALEEVEQIFKKIQKELQQWL